VVQEVSITCFTAFSKPSQSLPPAVAKVGCPPPPPCISFAASRTILLAFNPLETKSSDKATTKLGFSS